MDQNCLNNKQLVLQEFAIFVVNSTYYPCAIFVVNSTCYPIDLLGVLCFGSEGLPKLARRTYSSYLPPATIRCGSIASPSNLRSHPAGHTVPHFRNLFCKRTAPSISPCMRASLCKHKRPHSRQNIELTLYFCKKRFRKFAYVQFLLYLCTLNCKNDSIAA